MLAGSVLLPNSNSGGGPAGGIIGRIFGIYPGSGGRFGKPGKKPRLGSGRFGRGGRFPGGNVGSGGKDPRVGKVGKGGNPMMLARG